MKEIKDEINGTKTFIRITNKDIYDKLICIEKKLNTTKGQIKVLYAIQGILLVLVLYALKVI